MAASEPPGVRRWSPRTIRVINIAARLVLAVIVANLVTREFPERAEGWGSPLLVLLAAGVIWVVIAVAVFSYTNDQAIAWFRSRIFGRR